MKPQIKARILSALDFRVNVPTSSQAALLLWYSWMEVWHWRAQKPAVG